MNIQDFQSGKIVTLSKAMDSRAKILYIIYFAGFSIAVGAFSDILISTGAYASTAFIIFWALFAGAYLFAGYRFLNKALQTEKLVVAKNTLTVSISGFLSRKSVTYNTKFISNLRHLDKPVTTNHPLAGQTVDYLGFQTEQQVINELHGDNRIAFDYNGRTIKFGQNIYSWDFEEIENILLTVTGNSYKQDSKNKLHYDII